MCLALVPPLFCGLLLTPAAMITPLGQRDVVTSSSTPAMTHARAQTAQPPLRSPSRMCAPMSTEEDDEEKQGGRLTWRRRLRRIAFAAAWAAAMATPSGGAFAVPANPSPAVEPPPIVRTLDASRMMGAPRPGTVAARVSAKGAKASKKRGTKTFGDGAAYGASSGGQHRNGVAPLPLRVEDVARPKGAGRISDGACMIHETAHNAIMETIQEAESKAKTQIMVVTLPSIGKQSPRTFAKQLFNHWEIGGGRLDDSSGVLMLVVKDARRIEIKTGDRVRGKFGTSWTEGMLAESVLPKFKQGRYSDGLAACVRKCAMRLTRRRPTGPPDLTSELGINVAGLIGGSVWLGVNSWTDRRYRRKCDHCGYLNKGETPQWLVVEPATTASSGRKKATLHCSKCGRISHKSAIIPRISESSDSYDGGGGGGDGGGGGGSW